MSGEFLTPDQLCARYQNMITPGTLANWRSTKSGGGPTYIRIGNRIFYPVEEVIRWEKERTFRSTSEQIKGEQKATES